MQKGDAIIQSILENNFNEKILSRMMDDLLSECYAGYPIERISMLLEDSNFMVKKNAVRIISELGEEGCMFLRDIISMIHINDSVVVGDVLDIIKNCERRNSLQMVPEILDLLNSEHYGVRKNIIEYLASLQIDDFIKLNDILKNTTSYDKTHCDGVSFLATAPASAREQVKVWLKKPEKLYQIYAVIYLIKHKEYIAELKNMLMSIKDESLVAILNEYM